MDVVALELDLLGLLGETVQLLTDDFSLIDVVGNTTKILLVSGLGKLLLGDFVLRVVEKVLLLVRVADSLNLLLLLSRVDKFESVGDTGSDELLLLGDRGEHVLGLELDAVNEEFLGGSGDVVEEDSRGELLVSLAAFVALLGITTSVDDLGTERALLEVDGLGPLLLLLGLLDLGVGDLAFSLKSTLESFVYNCSKGVVPRWRGRSRCRVRSRTRSSRTFPS